MLHEVGRSGIEVTYIVHATSAERITNNQHQHWDERSGTFVVHVHNFRQNYICDPSSLHHTVNELSQFDSQFIIQQLNILFVLRFFYLETLQLR